ncbi:MAG: PRC-barrel domain-containing protein [Thermosynechococcaceae cyanobacterium MS004]|jgi:sporulation protein YlmC with PRC-barrel domain|nr:PRC-barrel domain-containing protein [Thermosynechococcaceae cyanobacterium MS004]
MTLSEQIQQRSDLIGTQVITRNTGKKLGVINQLWVDIDQREVVALGLRSTLVTGEQRYMYLENIRQIGDVVLVEDESAIEMVNDLSYSTLISHEVITETGEKLGKVRGFKFDTVNGELKSLVIASLGLPLIPSQLISTYEMPVGEIVSTGAERIIVFEGAEERLEQVTVGVLERLGLGSAPWEDDEENYIPTRTPTSNQLGSGQKAPAYSPPKAAAPMRDEWQEEQKWEPAAQRPPQEVRRAAIPLPSDEPQKLEIWEDDLQKDAWDDEPYEAPPLKLPERQKVTEYEREES